MLGQRELNLEDYIVILRRRWLLIAVLAVLGGGLGYAATRVLPKRYISKTLVLVQQPTVPTDYVKPVVSNDTDQRLAAMQQQILSRSRLEPIIRQLGLYGDQINKVPMEDLVGRLRKAIIVTPIEPMAETRSQGLPGFTVSVEFSDPRLAQQICTAITSMFMEENLKFRQQMTQETTNFIVRQLDDAKAELNAKDAALAAFQRQYLGSLPDQEQTNLNVLTSLNSQLDATTQALSRAQQDKSFAESMLSQQMATLQATKNGNNPQTYEQQLSNLETQLTTLQARYTDSYPDVIKAKQDIAALKKQIAASQHRGKSEKSDVSDTPVVPPPQIEALRAQVHQYDILIKQVTAQQEDVQQKIKMYQARVQSTPAVEEQYKKLTRDYQTALTFYNDLLKKRDDATMATDLEQRQQGQQFQVLDPANLPDQPSFPNQLYFVLTGFGGGLVLGCGLTLLLEFQDTSVRTEKDVEILFQLPVLAMVPTLKPLSGRNAKRTSIHAVARA
jgi:protein tyrosine kinase modulator